MNLSNLLKDNKELMKEYYFEKNKGVDLDNLKPFSSKKIWWKCKNGHEWKAVVSSRSKGHGCPYCSNLKALAGYNDLSTVNPQLAKEWNYEKNGDLKPSDVLPGSHKKVWWKCSKGHEWEKEIKERNSGLNCPYCSNQRVLIGYNDLSTTNPELLSEWDYNKNTISPNEITAGAEKMIWWICNKGHSYQSFAFNRKKSVGCPYCDGKKVLVGYNDLATINFNLTKEWDYKKNSNLKPTDITAGSHKKVHWKCQYGHEWIMSAQERNMGQNCPYCSNKRVLVGYNDLFTYCINNHLEDVITEFDTDKNKFTMKDVTAGSSRDTWWKCPNGHSYKSSPSRRVMKGSGCGICSHNILVKGINDLATTHPEIAKEWDYEKNKEKPDEVMAGSNIKKYWFICPKGHSYETTVLGRKRGTDCPQCNIENHTSFPERAIFYYLKQYIGEVEDSYHNPIIGRKEIDIFLPKYNFGIEYDGQAWHKDYNRDIEKDKVCYKNGIELLRVREYGCCEYDSTSIKTYITSYNMEELNNAILFIFNYLNKKFSLKIKPDVDVDRDRVKILELMNLSEKKNSLANYCPNIEEYWDYEKNGIIRPEQISHASEKKIYLKCSQGHTWISKAGDFVLRPYCPYCSGRKVWSGFNDLVTTHPEIAKEWNYEKNGHLKPIEVKAGSNKKVWWKCSKGHEWQAVINTRTQGYQKCKKCKQKN
ncbi:MAG: zinc-ribbon domain-containing protein [Bacilli bacterium]|nr:zinc-ribbon domain-containing protein [Bacilli bacterium]